MVRCERAELEIFVVTTRRIWLRTNAVVHGELFSHPNQLLREAMGALEEYQWVTHEAKREDMKGSDSNVVKWQPPPEHNIKLNWDAAVNVKEVRIGLDLIARDSRGTCLAARSIT